jgi:hypothetical protein
LTYFLSQSSSGTSTEASSHVEVPKDDEDEDDTKKVPRVEELDDDDESSTSTELKDTKPSSTVDPDNLLDDIVDTTLLSAEELQAKANSSRRVLAAAKDYNPVEREKSIAKRKALEQEIVRQTEEFDRLAEEARNKKTHNAKEKSKSSSADDDKIGRTTHTAAGVVRKASPKVRAKWSKGQWVKTIRCALLVILGVCVGESSTFTLFNMAQHIYERVIVVGVMHCC